jgi:hypothetical protein
VTCERVVEVVSKIKNLRIKNVTYIFQLGVEAPPPAAYLSFFDFRCILSVDVNHFVINMDLLTFFFSSLVVVAC